MNGKTKLLAALCLLVLIGAAAAAVLNIITVHNTATILSSGTLNLFSNDACTTPLNATLNWSGLQKEVTATMNIYSKNTGADPLWYEWRAENVPAGLEVRVYAGVGWDPNTRRPLSSGQVEMLTLWVRPGAMMALGSISWTWVFTASDSPS